MSEYPKDGSTFVTETIERTAYRWAKYKPDGARQMGKPGRWQKQVWSGDYFKWENCADPEGELSQPIEDGPISAAFKSVAALQAEIATLREALKDVLFWASHRCPADDESVPCPLCGARADIPGDACKAIESIFPRDLLKQVRTALEPLP